MDEHVAPWRAQLIGALLCGWLAAPALAGEALKAAPATPPPPGNETLAERIIVGMPVDEMLELVGRAPDETEHIGAGCGFLDIARWDEGALMVISVDGRVTSVAARPR